MPDMAIIIIVTHVFLPLYTAAMQFWSIYLMSSREALVHDVTKLPSRQRLLSLGGGLELCVDFVDLVRLQIEHLSQQLDLAR